MTTEGWVEESRGGGMREKEGRKGGRKEGRKEGRKVGWVGMKIGGRKEVRRNGDNKIGWVKRRER